MNERDLSPAALRTAVEREIDALGDPSLGVTPERLADVVLEDCDEVRRIARYMWAALAVSGEDLGRATVLREVENAAEHARVSVAAVGDAAPLSLGPPDEVLRLATDLAVERADDDSPVEGVAAAAGGVFFAQAIVLVDALARPETDFAAGLDATLVAHDAVADVAGRESVLECEGALQPSQALTMAVHCAVRLRDGRPFITYVDGLDASELRLAIARLCARLARADGDSEQPPDEAVWAQIEQQVADRLARIDPGPVTQHDLAIALLYRLTGAACNRELTDELFRAAMVEIAAIATTALAIRSSQQDAH